MSLTLKRFDGFKTDLLLGNFLEFSKNPLQFLQKNSEEFNSISGFKILNHNIIHIFSPEYLQHIIYTNSKNYGQGRDRDHMKLLFGNGLLTVDGELWKRQRKLLQPAFKIENILPFIRKIINCNTSLLEDLNSESKSNNNQTNFFDINDITLNLVNNIMGQILLSSEINPEATTVGDILLNLKVDTLNRLKKPTLPLWVPTPENVDYNHKKHLVEKIVNNIIEKRKGTNERPNDLLSTLMDLHYENTEETMNDNQLKDEIISIYAAGHEPTAIALSFALYLIYTNPKVEKKFNQEIEEVLDGKEPSFHDLKSMKYTLRIIQETLRLYPPVWISSKKALGDDNINNFKIKKGDNIIYSPYIMHRHKNIWEQPDRFDPDRFLSENFKNMPSLSYFPFGAGDKFCIGNNLAMTILQISLVMIAQKFKFNLKPDHKLKIEPFTTLRPKNGIMMSVQSLKQV